MPQDQKSRRRPRWPLWIGLVAGLAAVGLAGWLILGMILDSRAETDLREAIAAVDLAEPRGWQSEDLEARRNHVPDAVNSSKTVEAIGSLLPAGWDAPLGDDLYTVPDARTTPPPTLLDDAQAERLRRALAERELAITGALGLAEQARGRFRLPAPGRDHFKEPMPHLEAVGKTRDLLTAAGYLACHEGRYKQALAAAIGLLHTGRSLGDEPSIRAQLTRIGSAQDSLELLERLLGQCELAAGDLARVRSSLVEELRHDGIPVAMRGELAGQHRVYQALLVGSLTMIDVQWVMDDKDKATVVSMGRRAKSRMIQHSHAYTLRFLLRALDCLGATEPRRAECIRQWEYDVKVDKGGHRTPFLAARLMPDVRRIWLAGRRRDLALGCGIVALGAEEFRTQAGRWPGNFEELQDAGLLKDVPSDWDGKPLRVRRTHDGLVVFSVGQFDRQPYEGDFREPLEYRTYTAIPPIEFRLWDAEWRRLPSLPLPPLPELPEND